MKAYLYTASLLLSALTVPTAQADEPSQTIFVPAIAHLEGVGDVFGFGVSVSDLGQSDVRVSAGVVSGDVEAVGVAVSDVKWGKGVFSYAFLDVSEAQVETQYARGLSIATPYSQELSGSGHVFAYTLPSQTFSPLTWSGGLALTDVAIGRFFDASGRRIVINDNALKDIRSVVLNAGFSWDARETAKNNLKTGFKASTGLSLTTGRDAQSDQGQFDYALSQHMALNESLLLSAYLKGSNAFIISRDSAHDEPSEIAAQLDTNCAISGTPQQVQACQQWKAEVTDYILASNTLGTAKGLGGSTGLRSYSEQYFRSANQLLEGLELQYVLPFAATEKVGLQWVSFIEYAHSSDRLERLTQDSRYSVGTGLRAHINDIPLRLEYADGEEGDAWFLTAGLVW